MQAEGQNRLGYETTLILKQEVSPESCKALLDKLVQIIQAHQGELAHTEDWGKRRLAYPIQKEQKGQYFYLVYSGFGNLVQELERNLKINEQVLRFLTIRLGESFDSAAYLKKRADYLENKRHAEKERESRRSSHDSDLEDLSEDLDG